MQTELTAEDKSKDAFFEQIAKLSEQMVAAHGKEFSMGALVLGARWIAEGRTAGDRKPN
jgi:predicted PolB exonuclease-like 3'-5' exonuclease